MEHIKDTEIKNGHDKPGTLLEGGAYRVEFDSLGEVLVPANRLWGAQTQRSLIHFSIGDDHMPKGIYHAYGYVRCMTTTVEISSFQAYRQEGESTVACAR